MSAIKELKMLWGKDTSKMTEEEYKEWEEEIEQAEFLVRWEYRGE